MSDNELAKRFESTVSPHLDAAYNLARWLARDPHDADDVVQEAYLRAFRFFGGFRGGDGRAWLLAIFFGLGNGILTIARGTLPLAIFGPQNYGYRLGMIGAPARMAQAAAPLVFGLLIDSMGSRVLIVSSALSLSALVPHGVSAEVDFPAQASGA